MSTAAIATLPMRLDQAITGEGESAEALQMKIVGEKLDQLIQLTRVGLLGPDRIFRFLYEDQYVSFWLPFVENDLIQREIFRQRVFWEQTLLLKVRPLITPDAVILDAGANIGNHTIFFAKFCGAKKIYAAEPMNATHEMLRRNLEINNLIGKVETVNAALGEREGRASLGRYMSRNLGATSVNADDNGPYRIICLDSLQLQKLDLIKIDVEGFQIPMLKGAVETLQRCSPLLWVELNAAEEKPTIDFLNEAGYDLDSQIGKTDFLFRRSPGA